MINAIINQLRDCFNSPLDCEDAHGLIAVGERLALLDQPIPEWVESLWDEALKKVALEPIESGTLDLLNSTIFLKRVDRGLLLSVLEDLWEEILVLRALPPLFSARAKALEESFNRWAQLEAPPSCLAPYAEAVEGWCAQVRQPLYGGFMEEGLRHIISSPERARALEEVKRVVRRGELPDDLLVWTSQSHLERVEMREWEGVELTPLPNLDELLLLVEEEEE